MTSDEIAIIRHWLAQLLMGRGPAWPNARVDDVLRIAQAEGVVALAHARLQAQAEPVPETLRSALGAAARSKVALSLYRQAQARAMLTRFDAAALPALLLKGSALGHWAYAEPHLRECADIDLLLPTAACARRAVELLAPLGYVPRSSASAGDMVDFEIACERDVAGSRLEVDLHWHLSNAPLFAFRFAWDELWADATPLPALAPNARGLAPVPAFLHACMHRVQHRALGGQDRLKWLYDFVVLARRFGADDWRAVREQSAARGLAGVCADGLRAAEARFGSFVPGGLLDELASTARHEPMRIEHLHRWMYFQRMNWQAFPDTRMRWRWARQRLFPDRTYLRQRHGARGGALGALWRRLWAGVGRLRE